MLSRTMVVTVIVADTVTVVVDFGSWVGTNRPICVSAIQQVMLHFSLRAF